MESNRVDGKLRLGFMGFGEAASRFAKDLSQAGLSRMTRATRGMISEIAEMGLRERFGAREPERIAPVLEAIVETKGGT